MPETQSTAILSNLPDKRKLSVISFVRDHIQEITSAQQKGYSYVEIHSKLSPYTELTFTVGTLAKYVQRVNKEQQSSSVDSSSNVRPHLNVLPLPQKR